MSHLQRRLNRILVTGNTRRPFLAKRTLSVKKVLNAIFFSNKGPPIHVPNPKIDYVRGRFYRDFLLKKVELFYSTSRPASGIKYMHQLYDNTPPLTAHIVKLFLND